MGQNLIEKTLLLLASASAESPSSMILYEPEVPQQLLKKRQVKETASKEKNV